MKNKLSLQGLMQENEITKSSLEKTNEYDA